MIGRSALALCICLGVADAAPAVGAGAAPPMIAQLPAPGDPAPGSGQARALRDQAWAMLGREDRISPPDQPQIRCTTADADPLDIVAKAAAEAQIVIINEAHDSPRHRAFVEDVATRLAPLGYKTYVGEALAANVSTTGAPRISDGVFSNEPAYGALLRTLRRLGVTLVAYADQPPAQPADDYVAEINRQESLAASNIVNRVFVGDRAAKVLIHVGYSHNREDAELATRVLGRPREILWLARRLKDILGVDPLTIDQTVYAADRDGVCFTDEYGRAPDTGRDLYIAHPPSVFERGRPTWRQARGEVFAELPTRLRRGGERLVVEARRAGDPADAIPADRVLIDPGEDLPLLLDPGAYKVRAWTEAGAWTAEVALQARASPPPAPAPRPPLRRKKR